MSPSKIVIIVTGSISAYKSCELISLLATAGHQVKVIMSQSSEKFIGPTTLQTLSQNTVYRDDFNPETLMSHIELGKWCDLAIVYPATAQTINSLASGTGQELITSFFLAYDFKKPFLIAPAMNTRMLVNPVTQKSLQFLKSFGCHILDSEKGNLACGEVGEGRLLSPLLAFDVIAKYFNKQPTKTKRILITAGGTRETIDGVRTLTNMSTGKTGAELADYLYAQGFQVLLLTSRFSVMPTSKVMVNTYESFREIDQNLKALAKTKTFDLILHAAAISDYSIEAIKTPDGKLLPTTQKMSSQYDNISIQLKRNEKILPKLKELFSNHPIVVGFKLTSTESKDEQAKAIFSLFTENLVDYVVHNDMKDIKMGDRKFLMTSKEGVQKNLQSTQELSLAVTELLNPTTTEGVSHDLMS